MVRASSTTTRAGGLMPARSSSPRRIVVRGRRRASPSHPGSGYGQELDRRRAEASINPLAYIPKRRCRKRDPRDLINAYGDHTEGAAASSYEKFPKAPRPHVNGSASESAARSGRRSYWKDSDEDDHEFAWENMSPTLPDKSSRILESDFGEHGWPAFSNLSAEKISLLEGSSCAGDHGGKFSYMLPQSHDRGAHRSMLTPGQRYNVSERLLHLPHRPSGFPHPNQQSRRSILPPSPVQVSSHSFSHGVVGVAPALPSSSSWHSSPSAFYSKTDASSTASGFSSLISSLMEQGLISLQPPAKPQDILGTEFGADLVNVRNDSAIAGLYSALARQCATCGLRFESQEGHSSHMDWHAAKNRTSKGRKGKSSRSWYASTREWLSVGELVGSDHVPVLGCLPAELAAEKGEEKEIAVPAEDTLSSCSLCGEAFEEFYSDELEEWLYRGATYLNAPPNGDIEGVDRSLLGPLIHAKCQA